MPCRYLLENSHKFLCIVISCEGNSTIGRISVSQFSFLSILFYYFRKIPFSHSISTFRIYRWSTYNFSLFISISLTASLISFFFGADSTRKMFLLCLLWQPDWLKGFLDHKLKNGIYSTYILSVCCLFCI